MNWAHCLAHRLAGDSGDAQVQGFDPARFDLVISDLGLPDGGDGGPGGDVALVADRDLRDLSSFRAKRRFRAADGEPGRGALKHGATGETIELPVPAGTQVLDEDEQLWLAQLLDRLPDELDLEPVTALVYGVPKLARGLGIDDAPTEQVKADQKAFFRLLYNLLVDAERGPRLPTLFVALGAEKVRSLLTPPA